MSSSSFSRRALMKGAGMGLCAPLLREAFAATPTPGRLVIVMECNGIYPEAFLSTGARMPSARRRLARDTTSRTPTRRAP